MELEHKEKQPKIQKAKKDLWIQEQKYIKSKIILYDDLHCPKDQLRYIAGVDVSFSGKYQNGGCSSLIIYDCKSKKVVYQNYEYIKLTEPYVPGFLAFRQLPPTLKLFDDLKKQHPQFWPDLIMVDGNGIVHKFNCGYACHLGVVLNIPSIGCAKTFFDIDGLHQSQVEDMLSDNLEYQGQHMKIKGKSGRQWCTAVLSDANQNKNLYISQGTRISLDTATQIVLKYLDKETAQPVRIADRNSRKKIKQMSFQDYNKAPSYPMKYLSQ